MYVPGQTMFIKYDLWSVKRMIPHVRLAFIIVFLLLVHDHSSHDIFCILFGGISLSFS